MDQWAERENLLKAALGCFHHAIEDLEKNVFEIFPEKFDETAPSFEEEKKLLGGKPEVAELDAIRSRLHEELAGAGEKLRRFTSGTAELKEVLQLLSETARSLETSGKERVDNFREIADRLRSATEQPDAAQLRQSILNGLQTLNMLVERMRQDNASLLSQIECQMTSYRERLEAAERHAREDQLTQLGNRRLLEEQAAQYLAEERRFSLLMIDLHRFKAINDKHGHVAGDALLRAFAMRLRNSLRSGDTPVRWGGDEFVVLLPCCLRDAMLRAELLEHQLRGDYRVDCGRQSLLLNIALSIGVAEHKPGETVEDLLRRADQLLYHKKFPD
jgi:diguanylate cyclase